jgi:tRNA modification GTPase
VFAIDDTIVAIATPPGRGGIGVIRISGSRALEIAARLLDSRTPLVARMATYARIVDPISDCILDQVVATWFAAPHSYTGEEVVEISGHGSPVLLGRIVELAVALGSRLAEPGEFTLRAFLSGRIDLPQAEAVADLVDAVTPLQARAAMDQLEGTLTAAIGRVDAALFDLSARLEASLDFPDEGFHFVSRDETVGELVGIEGQLDALLQQGRAGRVIREGRTVVIAGLPNAGKSSLFNRLAGASRAIVTETPGTTRDLLTERVNVCGLALTMVDTAGLREARDEAEAEGVRRAQQAQQVASLTLVVVDGHEPLTSDAHHVIATAAKPSLVVLSKADLDQVWNAADAGLPADDVIAVSSITGAGIDALTQRIAGLLTTREDLRDPPLISNIRHLAFVQGARDAVARAAQSLRDGATEELVLTDLGHARGALEEVTGRRTVDDLLIHIFTRFCIGK